MGNSRGITVTAPGTFWLPWIGKLPGTGG